MSLVSSSQLIVNIEEGACIKPTLTVPVSLTELVEPNHRQTNRFFPLLGDLYFLSTSSFLSHLTKYTIDDSNIKFDLHMSSVIDIATNDDEVFVLGSSNIYIYNSQFQPVRKWDLKPLSQVKQTSSYGTYPSALAAIDNQLVVLYSEERTLQIYTVAGNFVKFVFLLKEHASGSCPPALVHGGDKSVLCFSPDPLSTCTQKGILTKVAIDTGQSVWSSEKQGVTAVARYKDKYVILASANTITIVDIQNG